MCRNIVIGLNVHQVCSLLRIEAAKIKELGWKNSLGSSVFILLFSAAASPEKLKFIFLYGKMMLMHNKKLVLFLPPLFGFLFLRSLPKKFISFFTSTLLEM